MSQNSMFEYSDVLTLSERVALRIIIARMERTERELRDMGLNADKVRVARMEQERNLITFSPK